MLLPMIDFRALAQKYQHKLKPIKVALFDVDGVLTDGKIYWSGEEVGWNRLFHTSDGYGLKMLKTAGIKVGVITGGSSMGVKKRFQELLDLDFFYSGSENKVPAFEDILKKANVKPEEVLYMGDEFFDLPLLKRVGFSATTKLASIEIQERVDYVAHREPGNGCGREVIDLLRLAQGWEPKEL